MNRTALFGLTLALLSLSCSSHPRRTAGLGPCEGAEPPEGCGRSCVSDDGCPNDLHCAVGGECSAECDIRNSVGCLASEYCGSNGRCFSREPAPSNGDCANVEVGARRVVPNVILIIDQSGSMAWDFGNGRARWDVLRDALLGEPDGFIYELQSAVRFGLALYSSDNVASGAVPADPPCPMMTTVRSDIQNYGAIASVYRGAQPIEHTPTGDAIDAVLREFVLIPDPPDGPTIFVLATDGEPDRCEQADPNPTPEAYAETLEAVGLAYRNGVRTFLIDVGNGVSDAHKQDVANAGLGLGPGDPNAPFWTVTDTNGLRRALETIIGGTLSCELELSGRIRNLDNACMGTVVLNDQTLPCGDPNGWEASDPGHVRLLGDACETLLGSQDATLTASFPCDEVDLI